MTDGEVAAALLSDAGTVVVEAAAGTGKTHRAAEAALACASTLTGGREVLLLAHTNAAIDEFRQRLGNHHAVRYETLDSFALSLVKAHPAASGLTTPIVPDYTPRSGWFPGLTAAAAALLQHAPGVARQVALHHPFVLLDEHQDARPSQHLIAECLRDAGARIRILGDPMQAIFEFDGDSVVDWEGVKNGADLVAPLSTPHRWTGAPELGEWLVAARDALARCDPLPRAHAPASVGFHCMTGVGNAYPRGRRSGPGLGVALGPLLRSLRGQVGILVPYRDSAFGVRGAIGRRVGIYEGHDVPIAHESADAAAAASGNAEGMIEVAIALAEATCTGVTTRVRTDAEACFPGGRFDMGRRRVVPPLVELLKPLALEPTVRQVGRFAAGLRANPPHDIKVDLRESLDAMAHVGAHDQGDQHTAIVDYMRRRRIASPAGQSQILTIHKAKGRAFDHVIVVHCSAGPFPNTEAGCRLLYVAITRARQSVHILASDTHPSPLLRLAG